MSLEPATKVRFTAATFGSICVAMTLVGWRAGNFLRDIRDDLADLHREVRSISNDSWSRTEQERWSYQLERMNRQNGLTLIVPDPRTINK